MVKNSFTLFETIISIVIVSLLIGSFFKISQTQNSIETYKELNAIQNHYIKTDVIKSSDNFKFK